MACTGGVPKEGYRTKVNMDIGRTYGDMSIK